MKVTVDAAHIEALLPQTQCEECGFAGCKPYAEALSQGLAPIDRCPPGGVPVLLNLARVLNQDAAPFIESVKNKTRPPALASIREEECIGCTKCISACPVDAILGTAKRMHTIIDQECTGCGLCIEPCPVDCIDLLPIEEPFYDKQLAAERFRAAKIRRSHKSTSSNPVTVNDKQAFILEAMARIRDKKT